MISRLLKAQENQQKRFKWVESLKVTKSIKKNRVTQRHHKTNYQSQFKIANIPMGYIANITN